MSIWDTACLRITIQPSPPVLMPGSYANVMLGIEELVKTQSRREHGGGYAYPNRLF